MKSSRERRRVLITSIHFAPELTGVGVYSGQMSEWLTRNGCEVRVICGVPFYPQWRTLDGFSNRYQRDNVGDGLTVYRCPLYVPRKLSVSKRALHLLSFMASSIPVMLMQLAWRPDVVVSVVPTYSIAPLSWMVARLSGARCAIHLQDLEVDAAFNISGASGSLPQKVALTVESWLLKRFDLVSTISNQMRAKLSGKGLSGESIVLFRNWVDLEAIRPLADSTAIRRQFDIPDGVIVCLYSGNMGRKQGIDMLAEAARKLEQRNDLLFLFCGDGEMRSTLAAQTGGLSNVRCMPLQPTERLNALLNCADIHLLPQRRAAADLVLPSKLGGIFASGRPVVAAADTGTELARMVEGCGVVVPPENVEMFCEAITKLASNGDQRRILGGNARRRAEDLLSRERILAAFASQLFRPNSASVR